MNGERGILVPKRVIPELDRFVKAEKAKAAESAAAAERKKFNPESFGLGFAAGFLVLATFGHYQSNDKRHNDAGYYGSGMLSGEGQNLLPPSDGPRADDILERLIRENRIQRSVSESSRPPLLQLIEHSDD